MYIVKVLQSGIELNSIKLEPGHTYYVGRGSDCDVVLNNEAGISRKHVKVSDETGQWQIELIARYGNIVFDNQNYTSLPIQGEMIVQIPPFELRIEAATKQATSSQFDSADKPDQTFTEFANNAPLVPKNNIPQPPMAPSVPAIVEQQVEGNMENTAEIELPIETILHIKLPEGKQEIVKLEGSSWVVGRDKNAEIPIKYDYLSKEHFEITKTEDGEYYITDLGSSNGTKVNNVALTPDNPQLLNSGDTISVKKLRFKLKIKDAEFNRKLDNIIEDEFNLPVVRSSDPFLPQPFAANQGQGVVPYDENENNFSFLKPMTYKNNKPKAAIFIILILGLIYFLSSDPTPQREVAEEKGDNSKFTNLSQEQKELINNSLDLANNHFQNGSYALCLAELVKVHKLVPDYNGSKKLKNHCEIGEKLRLENEARRAQEEKEKQIKEKIERIVSDCSAIFNQFKNMNELNTCLFEASELNPGDENVESLRRKMTEKMELKEQQLANQRARSHRIQEGQNKFNSAEATYKKGQLAKSIKQFERYLSEEYPDPNGLKSVAQRKLASIKKQLDTKISKLLNECRKNLDDENYKESFKSCQSALNEDPSNQEARDLKHEVRVKLTKKMKELYENASIEENYGNIDAAKELWLKIKKTDFDGGSQFYSKATKKLRKYGL